ncbi:Sec-independent protein translocase subunit TatA/TatB [Sphingobacterium endophyticum]|uniref:Sec-independent protein translocase subunit TatA/TatB n=1 Tax=Sphingobacterium endophyticum TaxID=2546448 RepID=UPI0012E13383|nr:twin-arginine translocase TatA/TatE family subunit [Sphingobacterium endophyticum]
MNLAFLNIGTQEMMLIILVALLLFGGKKLPELARGLGRGIREFKDASEGIKREISDQINNFEKEIDDIKTDIEKEPEQKQLATNTNEELEPTNDLAVEEADPENEIAEKKVPQFTAPAGTYEHKPYTTPTKDDYYSYGYNDHFASTDVPAPENNTEEVNQENSTPEGENNPLEENNSKQA